MNRKNAVYPTRLAAVKPKLEAWRDLVAKEATITARAVLELFAEQHLKLPKDQAKFETDLTEASAAAGDLIARKVVESLIATALPSEFAMLSRAYKTSNAGKADRERKGGRPALWKTKARAMIEDERLKLLKKSPAYIIEQLVSSSVLVRHEDGSYLDAKAKPMKRCAKNEKAMRAAITELLDSAKNKKIAK